MASMKGKNNPSFKHGLTAKHPLYAVWRNMKQRCYDTSIKQYKDYGGRGLTVCSEWLNSFITFYDWSIKNGWSNGLTLDRADNDLGYSPENCRFVDRVTQGRNQRTRVTNITSRGIDVNGGGFRVRVTVDKKTLFIGRYSDLDSAVKARKEYIQENKLQNFYS
jgi:hypothetical protein